MWQSIVEQSPAQAVHGLFQEAGMYPQDLDLGHHHHFSQQPQPLPWNMETQEVICPGLKWIVLGRNYSDVS